jgi:hypothetical protein
MVADEPTDGPSFLCRLTHTVRQRPKPEIQRPEAEHEGHRGEDVLEAVPLEAAHLQQERRGAEGSESERRHDERASLFVAWNVEARAIPDQSQGAAPQP